MKKKKLTLRQKESLTGFLFALPAIVGTVLFFLLPFVLNFAKSCDIIKIRVKFVE